jgi:hypothetical protein
VQRLQLTHTRTELVKGYAMDVERTMLARAPPGLGGVEPTDVQEALTALSLRADWEIVEQLAVGKRLASTARRLVDAHALR